MSAFENTDATFTACTPFLKLLEPTLLLSLFSGGALGVIAGNRYPADPHLFGLGFVSGGKKSWICRHALCSVSELFHMLLQTSFHEVGDVRPLFALLGI